MKSLSSLTRQSSKLLNDNTPTILTALAVSGTCATAVLASKASFTAARTLDEAWVVHRNTEVYEADVYGRSVVRTPMTFQEKAKLVWKLYIPAATVGSLTVASTLFSHRVSSSRAAAVAAAYSISEQAFDTYKKKVIERLGEVPEHEIRAAVAQDLVDRSGGSVIMIGDGKVLCFDEFTGRYFESTVEDIKKAQNDTNHLILSEGYASLSDFYQRIGLSSTSMSEEVGWTSDKLMELEITSVMSPDQRPAVAIAFRVAPVRNYWKMSR